MRHRSQVHQSNPWGFLGHKAEGFNPPKSGVLANHLKINVSTLGTWKKEHYDFLKVAFKNEICFQAFQVFHLICKVSFCLFDFFQRGLPDFLVC